MKKYASKIFFSLGWILLILFLLSGHFYNKFSIEPTSKFSNYISWENNLQIFNGAVQCTLMDDDLLERKKILKEDIFSKVVKKEEIINGLIYYFNDDDILLNQVLEFVQKEKACCPFFKFDVSILPFGKGFAIQISGSEEAFELLKDFEENEY